MTHATHTTNDYKQIVSTFLTDTSIEALSIEVCNLNYQDFVSEQFVPVEVNLVLCSLNKVIPHTVIIPLDSLGQTGETHGDSIKTLVDDIHNTLGLPKLLNGRGITININEKEVFISWVVEKTDVKLSNKAAGNLLTYTIGRRGSRPPCDTVGMRYGSDKVTLLCKGI